jgi:hypothetical protein
MLYTCGDLNTACLHSFDWLNVSSLLHVLNWRRRWAHMWQMDEINISTIITTQIPVQGSIFRSQDCSSQSGRHHRPLCKPRYRPLYGEQFDCEKCAFCVCSFITWMPWSPCCVLGALEESRVWKAGYFPPSSTQIYLTATEMGVHRFL